MGSEQLAECGPLPRVDAPASEGTPTHARVSLLFERHYDFVWRSVRRLGVLPGDVDDAAQRVFLVLVAKLAEVRAGAERAFLFQTAVRVAADDRRARRRRREHDDGLDGAEGQALAEAPDDPFDRLARRETREHLDRVLDAMPLDLRAVLVLFELEELTREEIAATMGLPPGTVASRLRRAKELFSKLVRRGQLPARDGGGPRE
jgi:RNA polymerase sigma-70 factor (ECF subfamily)